MSLDILTPKGQEAAAQQIEAMEIVFARSPERSFIHMPDKEEQSRKPASPVDGWLVEGIYAVAVAEVKSRDYTYETLCGEYQCEWLVSMHKLTSMANVSRIFCVPGFGFLYLVPSRMVIGTQFTDDNGLITCKYRTARTTTQATCNGGTANRLNAFISMKNAKVYLA